VTSQLLAGTILGRLCSSKLAVVIPGFELKKKTIWT